MPRMTADTIVNRMPALELRIVDRTVRISNPDVLYPATGFTKRDVVEYLLAIAGVLLPHPAGKAVTLARFPDGVATPRSRSGDSSDAAAWTAWSRRRSAARTCRGSAGG
jgi:bifunctional non-homologous end joining protein LigD